MKCPACDSDDTKFWWMASTAVCHTCDTYWRPNTPAVVTRTSDLDFDDPDAIDEFVDQLFGVISAHRESPDHKPDAAVDLVARFTGDGALPTPQDFHRRFLVTLVTAFPGAVPFWTGGGTPKEFSLRVLFQDPASRAQTVEEARGVLEAEGCWTVVDVREGSEGGMREDT